MKKLLLSLLAVLATASPSSAGVVYSYFYSGCGCSPYTLKGMEENVKTLKNYTKVCVVKGTNEGIFYKGKKYSSYGKALKDALKDCGNDWLIFAGDSRGTIIFSTGKKNYTTFWLKDFLTKNRIHLHFLGFDLCKVGSPAELESFQPYADVVAGSPEIEPSWGWQGVYENFPKVKKDVYLIPYLYNRYNIKKWKRLGFKFYEVGVFCTELDLLTQTELQKSRVCYYLSNEGAVK
jgi:hypothetical protein